MSLWVGSEVFKKPMPNLFMDPDIELSAMSSALCLLAFHYVSNHDNRKNL